MTSKHDEMIKALTCLYLEVPKVIGDDVKAKVMARIEELEQAARSSDDWPRAYYYHSQGQSSLGMELFVKLDRPTTDADKKAIWKATNALQQDLLAESARLHPDNIAWKKRWLVQAREMFDEAGLTPIYIREIDNKYCGLKCCPHRVWLLVTTPIGVIEIGWRKRVLSIDWSASDVAESAAKLFPNEDVTKGERMIHAWSYDKATEYLTRIAHEPIQATQRAT